MYVFTKYSKLGASSRVRFHKYIELGLIDLGNEKLKISNLFNDEYLKLLYEGRRSKLITIKCYVNRLISVFLCCFSSHRIVWIEKEIFPHIPIPFELMFKFFGKKVIFDYDDAVFHNYDKGLLSCFFKFKFRVISKFSDLMFVGNEYLRDYFVNLGCTNIKIIPTVIAIDRFDQKKKFLTQDRFVIGWIGSPSTQKYLSIVDDVIFSLQKKYNGSCDIFLHLVGANDSVSLNSKFKIIPWSEETESLSISEFDVGIMPLFDSPFERGKCGYKLIQYFASRKAVIASPIGVNKSIVRHGVDGYLCIDSNEWYDCIDMLITNRYLCDSFGDKGFEKIENHYTYSAQSELINTSINLLK